MTTQQHTTTAPPVATEQVHDLMRIFRDAAVGAVFVSRGTLRAHRAANPQKYPYTPKDGPTDATVDAALAGGWLEAHLRRGKNYVGSTAAGRRLLGDA